VRVGRSRPPPPPPTLAVATGWLLSTIFAVLLALAHVIAASKTATTAKDFAARDFMMPALIFAHALCLWSAGDFVMSVTESAFYVAWLLDAAGVSRPFASASVVA
jgi:hypothetical protein